MSRKYEFVPHSSAVKADYFWTIAIQMYEKSETHTRTSWVARKNEKIEIIIFPISNFYSCAKNRQKSVHCV
jgi:hypothetical protein